MNRKGILQGNSSELSPDFHNMINYLNILGCYIWKSNQIHFGSYSGEHNVVSGALRALNCSKIIEIHWFSRQKKNTFFFKKKVIWNQKKTLWGELTAYRIGVPPLWRRGWGSLRILDTISKIRSGSGFLVRICGEEKNGIWASFCEGKTVFERHGKVKFSSATHPMTLLANAVHRISLCSFARCKRKKWKYMDLSRENTV